MLRVTPIACFLALTSAALAGSPIESTFDTDAEGWSIFSDGQNFTWTDQFGNPGGSIRATDVVAGDFWSFSASEAFLGDKSGFFGGELSWDIYGIIGNQALTNRADVMLVGGGVQIGINLPVMPQNGAWTSWSVLLDTSEDWRRVSSLGGASLQSTPATSDDIVTVLGNLEAMYIRGEYTNGNDSTALDNVRLAPPPCGDANGDGDVDLDDLNLVLTNFGFDTEFGDVNDDGTVNLDDLNLVLTQFGGSCGVVE